MPAEARRSSRGYRRLRRGGRSGPLRNGRDVAQCGRFGGGPRGRDGRERGGSVGLGGVGGDAVGPSVGDDDGRDVAVGAPVGRSEGVLEGDSVGDAVGTLVGRVEDDPEGDLVGGLSGAAVGGGAVGLTFSHNNQPADEKAPALSVIDTSYHF